ncbi:MAG: hypothetical protein LH606_19250 [Cytophagaceae bacterium]|nr:hypothetical protein [Cytophagaceae bacterium]
MEPTLRNRFNEEFTEARYQAFLADLEAPFPGQLEFRVAETPVFIPKPLGQKLVDACESIIDVVVAADFDEKTKAAIPAGQAVPNENGHTSFLAIDFAICKDDSGNLTPQLIELQGFPSIFAFQSHVSEAYRKHFTIPPDWSNYFGVTSQAEYIEVLRKVLLGGEKPEHVILLEIYPEKQKTRADFAVTEHLTGVRAVCLTKIQKEGRQLFYDRDGVKTRIHRIYNRLIFDDLQNYPDLKTNFQFTDDVDVTWVGHPNWFFRISKYTLPFLGGPHVPESRFLDTFYGAFPENLENYVLKPLFSFAGSGVNLHPTPDVLRAIENPHDYLLQRKVAYEPVVLTPDGSLVKCEIRMLYVWPDGDERPRLLTNLARLSRGEMIGVRFNKDFTWVGGSICFFEPL